MKEGSNLKTKQIPNPNYRIKNPVVSVIGLLNFDIV
jgi:hypothetical protein